MGNRDSSLNWSMHLKLERLIFTIALLVSLTMAPSPSLAKQAAGGVPATSPAAESSSANKPMSLFEPTPALDIAGRHDFANQASLSEDAAVQLKGLCSLAEFRSLPVADRFVYAFDAWPIDKDSLDAASYTFNFRLGGAVAQKVAFLPSGGGPGGSHLLTRTVDVATKQVALTNFGNLAWGSKSTHSYKFDKPVLAFGVVVRCVGDFELRKYFWQAAHDLNGYPVSYTLTDGTVVNVGARELRGALLKGGTDTFIGVIDHSGHGITSVSYTIAGAAGNVAQDVKMLDIAFVTLPAPATANVINLKGRADFETPEMVVPKPETAVDGLASLD